MKGVQIRPATKDDMVAVEEMIQVSFDSNDVVQVRFVTKAQIQFQTEKVATTLGTKCPT